MSQATTAAATAAPQEIELTEQEKQEQKKRERESATDSVKSVWYAIPSRIWTAPSVAPVDNQVLNKWWSKIDSAYWQPTRFYHTMQHINSMLRTHHTDRNSFAAKNFNNPRTSVLIDLAIIFHDIVYDPKAKDNEEKSAAMWRDFVKESKMVTADEVEKVASWILATKNHTATPPTTKDTDPELALFLDIDLLILSAPLKEYNDYAANVRLEYSHLSDQDFQKGRLEVLKGFAASSRLFFTDPFHRFYESKAKENIAREIKSLEG
eukprot:TRINITY_DN15437_c0_g1_i1.p1 TRINITY_DN15437_c0_g1~~TRINITY_DN15437_c0_g1_i1.p1  ORF type:complete len:265 (-),score=74.90 TRINITY_DN15437_c0_g1_i1:93-887(-)